ncbi:MAG: EAL domain-containing protein [Sphaerochaetaceae bacterium]|nr:EAL domain-containing protein [Spirochaetales bacterium]MDY5498719.1 EAL domain-containing protein [Sphaerochaetaceae bacterium]
MDTTPSGCYMIDEHYTVISVNRVAREMYPQLREGDKCYRCLGGVDAPCERCPVHGGLHGARTYYDPVRGIAEIVDAVEVPLEGHGLCHILVFQTAGEQAELASTLPVSSDGLKELAFIKALTADYRHVVSVDMKTRKGYVYRKDGVQIESLEVFQHPIDYEKVVRQCIERHVYADDQDMLLKGCDLNFLAGYLRTNESLLLHYRVREGRETHYNYVKFVRIGEAETFGHVLVGIACEDGSVLVAKKTEELERNLSLVEVDSLTGLYTKEAFLLYSEKLRQEHPDKDFDFCVLQVGDLKALNRRYGKGKVDRLLRLVGRTLTEYKDAMTCLMYMGSGMFACYHGTMEGTLCKSKCEAFSQQVRQKSSMKDVSLKWSVYVAPRHDLHAEEILEKTQYALSTIRTDTNENYVEFDQSMVDRMEWEKSIEANFEQALADHEISVWYQPKYLVGTGKIVGAEALARWIRPDGSSISPAQFIPILERSGNIRQLDEHVFRTVCRMERRLMERGYRFLPVSVNLSRASAYDGDTASRYKAIASEYAVPFGNLPIEITESAAVNGKEINILAGTLTEKGFPLHMDDFGTGFSSLASLETIPFESIKLDKSLIDFIGRKASESLLTHIISYAKETGKVVVAEGVETADQYEFLKRAGCDMVQGFLFSKPLDEEAFWRLLETKPDKMP